MTTRKRWFVLNDEIRISICSGHPDEDITEHFPEDQTTNEENNSKRGKIAPNLLHIFEEPSFMSSDREATDDDAGIGEEDMYADDFNNKATEYARRNRYEKTARLCMQGLKKHPGNINLLAVAVKHSASGGNKATATWYPERLLEQSAGTGEPPPSPLFS